jgi:hypothetical protein
VADPRRSETGFTPGRFVLADTDEVGARDPIGLTSQVKYMRGGMEKAGATPGLILIVVDEPERKAAVRLILNALDGSGNDDRIAPSRRTGDSGVGEA